jgi:hypothetical protein
MEAKKIETYRSDKIFQVWDYLVSHSHFLLRCPGAKNHSENIDIIFNYTKYIETTTVLRGIELCVSQDRNAQKAIAVRTGLSIAGENKLFALKSEGRVFYLVAHAILIHTNTLPMFESPLQAILGIPESTAKQYADKITSSYVLL